MSKKLTLEKVHSAAIPEYGSYYGVDGVCEVTVHCADETRFNCYFSPPTDRDEFLDKYCQVVAAIQEKLSEGGFGDEDLIHAHDFECRLTREDYDV